MPLRDYIAKRPLFDAPLVSIQSAKQDDFDYWKCVIVHALTPQENGGNHNIYVDVIDEQGRIIQNPKNLSIYWGWEGQKFVEHTTPIKFDKPAPEAGANIPIFDGQKILCSIADNDHDSDIVRGLNNSDGIVSSDGLNRVGHFSTYLVFQLTKSSLVAPVTTPRTLDAAWAAIDALDKRLKAGGL